MVLITAECSLVLSNSNLLANAISSSFTVASVGAGNTVLISAWHGSASGLVPITSIGIGSTPRCFAWSESTRTAPTQWLIVGDRTGGVSVMRVDLLRKTISQSVRATCHGTAPVTQLQVVRSSTDICVLASTAAALYRLHFSLATDSSRKQWDCHSLSIGRPLGMGYDKMNDQLTIVRKTGECVVVSHPGMDDAVMTHFLQSETQSGESMLLGGQPVAACFMPSTRHMRYCLYAPSASTGNLSSGPPAVPKAIAPTSLVSVVAGSTMDGESDIDLEATPLAAVKASKGTFPHALPGRSILDALYVPSTASLRRYQDDSSAGDTKIATSAACLEVVRPRMPSPAPPAPTSGVLESLLSIAASPREEGPRACRDMGTMAPADVTRVRVSLFSVVQSSTSVHPRILGAGAVDLGAMGIAMDRPDMWAYHAFDGVVGLRGVLAVGSTTSPKLHLILERHDETYVHLHSLDVSSEVEKRLPPAVCKGIAFGQLPDDSDKWLLFVLAGRRVIESNSLASASIERTFQTEMYVYDSSQFSITTTLRDKNGKGPIDVIGNDTANLSWVEELLSAFRQMESRLLDRIDQLERRMELQSDQLTVLVEEVGALRAHCTTATTTT